MASDTVIVIDDDVVTKPETGVENLNIEIVEEMNTKDKEDDKEQSTIESKIDESPSKDQNDTTAEPMDTSDVAEPTETDKPSDDKDEPISSQNVSEMETKEAENEMEKEPVPDIESPEDAKEKQEQKEAHDENEAEASDERDKSTNDESKADESVNTEQIDATAEPMETSEIALMETDKHSDDKEEPAPAGK